MKLKLLLSIILLPLLADAANPGVMMIIQNKTSYSLSIIKEITTTDQTISPFSDGEVFFPNDKDVTFMGISLSDADGGVNKGSCVITADFDLVPPAIYT